MKNSIWYLSLTGLTILILGIAPVLAQSGFVQARDSQKLPGCKYLVFVGEKLIKPARLIVLHNGVLVHLDQELYGETRHRQFPAYRKIDSVGPVSLPAHYCAVRFRNIWVRELK